MSQSPLQPTKIDTTHPYAEATAQLNKLVRLGQSFSGHERNCLYLNERNGHFANASAVGGIDDPDDGRCVVRCDWDHDGDLDLWVSNRTAPRLKFLRNEFASNTGKAKSHDDFVAFKLIGTKSNRDAIGARVILQLAESKGRPDGDVLTQSVRCGEGFLGQSSSWLHFGVGDHRSIRQLEVRWPTGKLERFPPPEPGGFYELVEGDAAANGQPRKWQPGSTQHSSPASAESTSVAVDRQQSRNAGALHFLSQSLPLPPLTFSTFEGDSADATQANGKPTLLNLWASWCSPCVTELTEWSEHSDKLASEGLRIVAASVDDLDKTTSRDDSPARELIKRIGFQHPAGMASPQLVEILQLVNNTVYAHDHRPLPIPSSFLIDGEGRLAAIYKGAVNIDRVLSDAKTIFELGTNDEKRMQTALPFPGRWIANQGPHRASKLAAALWESGFGPQSIALAERMDDAAYRGERAKVHWANAMGMRSERKDLAGTARQLQAVLDLNPTDPKALSELGILNAQQGNLPQAVELFTQAVKNADPPDAGAHFNLAKSLLAMNKKEEGMKQLIRAVEIDSAQSQAHDLLGQLFAGEREFEKAAEHFSNAWRTNPGNVPSLLNLVSALMETGDNTRAHDELQTFLKREPEDAAVRVYLAQVLLRMERTNDAIKQLEDVVQQQPKASRAWLHLSQLETARGNWAKAVNHLKRVTKLVPNDPNFEAELAWLLATVPDPEIRNGTVALEIAKRSATATERKDPRILEILAAAHAETGDFELAGQALRQAIDILKPDGPNNEKRSEVLRRRIQAVQNAKPHRISATENE